MNPHRSSYTPREVDGGDGEVCGGHEKTGGRLNWDWYPNETVFSLNKKLIAKKKKKNKKKHLEKLRWSANFYKNILVKCLQKKQFIS